MNRHRKSYRCPICDGRDEDDRGGSRRCFGFTSDDGMYVHCSREELAGSIEQHKDGTYVHIMSGPCKCGQTHGSESRPRGEDFEAVYQYQNEASITTFEVCRKPRKGGFIQRRVVAGERIWGLDGTKRLPYKLPELLKADPERTVYVVEGEKDVETAMRIGLVATCNPGGAEKWHFIADLAAKVLAGRDIVIVVDDDEPDPKTGKRPGHDHARQVFKALKDVTRSVVMRVPPKPHKDLTDLIEAGGSVADLVPFEEEKPKYKTLGQLARELALMGPVVRLETGLPTLDRSCRGGIPTPRLIFFGGAPGAGKTTLATCLAWRWAKQGVPVVFLAQDEGWDGVLMRIAQMEGFSTKALEDREPGAWDRLGKHVDQFPLIVLDGEDAMGTVEAAAEVLAQFDPSKPRVLVVDSVQTVRAEGTDDSESPKARVEAVVASLKRQRNKYRLLVMATCELSRASYRNRSQAENINDLAAFKESGAVEYAAQTALVLRSVSDEPSLVDVSVPKNRAYKKDPFRLRLDFQTTTFTEVENPNVESPEANDNAKAARIRKQVAKDAAELFALILRRPGLGSKGLRLEAQGKLGWGVPRLNAALHALEGKVEQRANGQKLEWFVAGSPDSDTLSEEAS